MMTPKTLAEIEARARADVEAVEEMARRLKVGDPTPADREMTRAMCAGATHGSRDVLLLVAEVRRLRVEKCHADEQNARTGHPDAPQGYSDEGPGKR